MVSQFAGQSTSLQGGLVNYIHTRVYDNVLLTEPVWLFVVYDTGLYDDQATKEWAETMQQNTRNRRDVFEETKYVELVIVADFTEVNKIICILEIMFWRWGLRMKQIQTLFQGIKGQCYFINIMFILFI